ncbi:MAG: hypothetical protein J6S71_09190 [Clostridia bacterium]|nr:hypothetical protein [Clostridia bacterium]
MKKFTRIIALILALLALPMCFIACDKGGADETEDPNDTTDGIRVMITVSGLEEKDGTRTPLLKTRDAEIFRVDPGTTLSAALDALCADREGASYTLENTGRFASFTYGSDSLVAEVLEEKGSGDAKMYVEVSFKITVNGTEIKPEEAPGYVLNHNDNVQIFLVKGEPFAA